LCIVVRAFLRCRKWGYAVIACYFALAFFWLIAGPAIDRTIRVHRQPDILAQTRQKIDAAYHAYQQNVQRILADEGHPDGIPMQQTIHFPLSPILLVVGLWLVARRETPRSNIPRSPTT
jgi:hypothetical protein